MTTWRKDAPETIEHGFDQDWHRGLKMKSKKRYYDTK